MEGLKEKAIAAYEASKLKQDDDQETQTAREAIRFALSQYGFETTVSSDVFIVEDMLFTAESFHSGQTRRTAFRVKVYRLCAKCKKPRELELGQFHPGAPGEARFTGLKIEQFGQWLAARRCDECKFDAGPADFVVDQTSD